MDIDNVTVVAFSSAAAISLLLTITFISQLRQGLTHRSFAMAGAVQTLWASGFAFIAQHPSQLNVLTILEVLHFFSWIAAAILTTEHFCDNKLPKRYKYITYGVCSIFLAAAVLQLYGILPIQALKLFVWQGIALSILSLLAVEQLYRNITNIRLIKLLCLSTSAPFIYDIYFFSQSLLQTEIAAGFLQVRAVICIVSAMFMGLAAITLNYRNAQTARLSLSRPVVFYTTSLTLAGTLISILALGGYYIRIYGGDWGVFIFALLLCGASMSILFVFASRSIREKLTVLINKHLFSHKYDYRTEWLRLIEVLSQPRAHDEVHGHALSAVGSIFKSQGGAIWMRRGKIFVPVHSHNININLQEVIEPDSTPFIDALQISEWVFLPSSVQPDDSLSQFNEHLPSWAKNNQDIWLILPLLSETHLTGFLALTPPSGDPSLNWEDLDLLKTVGRQVSNYLKRHEQAEELAEARQFEAFNKLAAYVMHDLKNLIAQQSLVVKNAEKHKDNPAFIDDAIQTINNSVNRMNNLLRKLQRNEAESVRVLSLNEVMIDSIKRCQKELPQPSLVNNFPDARVKGDFDSLAMVFAHIIHNAQDATPNSGFIDIHINQENQMVNIEIEDNGSGMDEDFIRDRLFKPFDTTKTGKGMGIGVYQAREYILNIGGSISVESALGEGTTFFISLPTVAG